MLIVHYLTSLLLLIERQLWINPPVRGIVRKVVTLIAKFGEQADQQRQLKNKVKATLRFHLSAATTGALTTPLRVRFRST